MRQDRGVRRSPDGNPCRFFSKRLGLLAVLLAAGFLPLQTLGFPEPDGEFFVDLSGRVGGRDKVEVSHVLRTTSEACRVHCMMVVISTMKEYSKMPQDIAGFTSQVSKEWAVADTQTKNGLVVLFSLEDRKYAVSATKPLDSTGVEDSIHQSMQGQVVSYLKEDNVSAAMKAAAVNVSDRLSRIVGSVQSTGAEVSNPSSRRVGPSYRQRCSSGSGSFFGWIIGLFGLFLVIRMVLRFLGGQGGGGLGMFYPTTGSNQGSGGFFSGLMAGGLLGWLFGHQGGWGSYDSSYYDSSSSSSDSSSSWSSSNDSSSTSSSGFEGFGGGNWDGGGSSGEW